MYNVPNEHRPNNYITDRVQVSAYFAVILFEVLAEIGKNSHPNGGSDKR